MTNKYDLTTEAVVAYEAQKVVSIFKPLAEATMDQVDVESDASVIDIACGTGIIGRTIRHRYGQGPAVTGVDLSSAMIAKAKSLCNPLGGRFSWIVCDASKMPVADHSYSTCFCQQGIQYMPDDVAAIGEMVRVLAVGGQLIVTVWGPANAYFEAQSAAFGRHVGKDWAAKAVAPFAYRGNERLPHLMASFGLDNILVEQISIDRVIRDAEAGVTEDIEGSPLLPAFRAATPETRALIVEDILSDCDQFQRGNDLIIPQHCHLFTGRRT